jgi:hypothetical protein
VRALEWERRDLLGSNHDAERLQRQYAAFLGEEAVSPPHAAEAQPSAPVVGRVHAAWVPILVGLALTFATALVYFLGEVFGSGGTNGDGALTSRNLRLLAVGLVSVSSLLLLAAVLPASVVARSRMPPASYARYRQPLALAAIGILAPVTLFALLLAIA